VIWFIELALRQQVRNFLFTLSDLPLVYSSIHLKFDSASSILFPHISTSGLNPAQTFGLSGCPKIRHLRSSLRFTHLTKASFPSGIPGMGELMEGKMQQAPQPGRQIKLKVKSLKPACLPQADR
jgi:hypothetical protein